MEARTLPASEAHGNSEPLATEQNDTDTSWKVSAWNPFRYFTDREYRNKGDQTIHNETVQFGKKIVGLANPPWPTDGRQAIVQHGLAPAIGYIQKK